jgi:hypothetical protein
VRLYLDTADRSAVEGPLATGLFAGELTDRAAQMFEDSGRGTAP